MNRLRKEHQTHPIRHTGIPPRVPIPALSTNLGLGNTLLGPV
jgi:hypothetical protein